MTRRGRMVIVVAIGVATAIVSPVAARAAGTEAEGVTIPMPAVGEWPATTMRAEVYRPEGEGPFPVVIYSHGRAGKPEERAALVHPIPRGHAGYWMRRGFAVVAPIRPGYGEVGAADRERSGTRIEKDGQCGGAIRLAAASEASAAAVRATVDWVRRQAWVEKDRLLLVGTSAGGVATVAAAGARPPGVIGFVGFSAGAAGYPEKRPGASCGEAALAEVFRRAGRGVSVPNLWLYAENDRYWGAEAPRVWHAAFAGGGSPTRFVMTAPVPNEDGHKLMLRGGRLWSTHVDPFVAGLGFAVPAAKAPVSSPAPE